MRAWVMNGYGGNEVMELREMPEPTAGERDVLIEIHSASVNPVDFKIRDGKLKAILPLRLPQILGNDGAGTVLRTGARATRFKAGDAVYFRAAKNRIGTFAERIALDESDLALKPAGISMEEAAGIPLVGLTTVQALEERARLRPGQRVLIHAGAGGVGTFAIQFAKVLGAWVATTASAAGEPLLKSLGADLVIDYRGQRFEETLRDCDAVFDTLGGETLLKSFSVLRPGGVVVSVSGPPDPAFATELGRGWPLRLVFALLSRKARAAARATGTRYSFLFMRPDGAQLARIGALIERGAIRPRVDRVFPFAQGREALAYVETGRAKGKVIVRVTDRPSVTS